MKCASPDCMVSYGLSSPLKPKISENPTVEPLDFRFLIQNLRKRRCQEIIEFLFLNLKVSKDNSSTFGCPILVRKALEIKFFGNHFEITSEAENFKTTSTEFLHFRFPAEKHQN